MSIKKAMSTKREPNHIWVLVLFRVLALDKVVYNGVP